MPKKPKRHRAVFPCRFSFDSISDHIRAHRRGKHRLPQGRVDEGWALWAATILATHNRFFPV